jgi:hypothetical protein
MKKLIIILLMISLVSCQKADINDAEIKLVTKDEIVETQKLSLDSAQEVSELLSKYLISIKGNNESYIKVSLQGEKGHGQAHVSIWYEVKENEKLKHKLYQSKERSDPIAESLDVETLPKLILERVKQAQNMLKGKG